MEISQQKLWVKHGLDPPSQGTLGKGITEAQVLPGGPWTRQHAEQTDDAEKQVGCWRKKLIYGKHFSRNFHPPVWIIPAIPLKSVSTERLISCYIFFFFHSWRILNPKLLETLTAALLPVIVSLFYLVLSKLCHQLRYDHTDCHPSVYCINCSSIHKIQHRWKFTHPNEVLFSFLRSEWVLAPLAAAGVAVISD